MDESEKIAVQKILIDIDHPVVVSLGAYHGEDDPVFRSIVRRGSELLHVMVEPDPRNIQTICGCLTLSPMRRLIQGAVAANHENRCFNLSFDSRDGSRGSGSILKPTGHLEHFPTITFRDTQMVQCYTLDEIFTAENLTRIDLLWVDIQGAEKEMIAGGKAALAKTRYCFMEAENQEFYEGQALKPELIALMEGWELMEDFGYNILLRNKDCRA
jgi:FkbM family methyltransferase